MKVLVVYESMFGATRSIAEAVAGELGDGHEVTVTTAGNMIGQPIESADLVVVGAPTHAHGLPRPSTRRSVPDYVNRSGGALHAEASSQGPGVREWLRSLGAGSGTAVAAFDTRLQKPALLVGQPSKKIGRVLRSHGYRVVGDESFFVDGKSLLLAGELDRARRWARHLVPAVTSPAKRQRPAA